MCYQVNHEHLNRLLQSFTARIYSEDAMQVIAETCSQFSSLLNHNHLNQSVRGSRWDLSFSDSQFLQSFVADLQSVLAAQYWGNEIPNSVYTQRVVNQGREIINSGN